MKRLLALLLVAIALPVYAGWWSGGGGGTGTFDNSSALIAPGFYSSAPDNTRSTNVMNTADPTGENLAAGNVWTLSTDVVKLRSGDNTATYAIVPWTYERVLVDAPAVTDNGIIAGPLDRQWVIDNVIAIVQDNTGKLTGSANDNVTFSLAWSTAADNTYAQSTKIVTDNVALGSAVLSPTLTNATVSAGAYIRLYISAANATNRKLYIRLKWHRL